MRSTLALIGVTFAAIVAIAGTVTALEVNARPGEPGSSAPGQISKPGQMTPPGHMTPPGKMSPPGRMSHPGRMTAPGTAQGAPRNDDLRQATAVRSIPFVVFGLDTLMATTEKGEPLFPCAPVSQTVWYQLDVESAGHFVLDTDGSTYDTVVSVYSSQGNRPKFDDLALLGCNDDFFDNFFPLTSHLEVDLQPGRHYIQVGNYGSPSLFEPHTLNLTVIRN